MMTSFLRVRYYFYPRPPRGGRRHLCVELFNGFIFLSTPSARRATYQQFRAVPWRSISIHALREEGDMPPCTLLLTYLVFLSTPSARRATWPV